MSTTTTTQSSPSTVGNGTTETVATICALPSSGDLARITVSIVSRLSGSASVARAYAGTGVVGNSGGTVTVSGLSEQNKSVNSPAFGAVNLTSSGTNVVAEITHAGGGSNTIDHDVVVTVEVL